MPKKKAANAREPIPESFENDPPPPYSPSEASQPPLSGDSASIAPSAPTATDVGFYSQDEVSATHNGRESQYMDPSAPPHRYNYGSVEPPGATGDVYQAHEQNQSLLHANRQQREQAQQHGTMAQQQRELARQQRDIAQQQREQAYQQREQRRHQGNQSTAQGDTFHTLGDRLRDQGSHLRSQLAGLGDQIRNSLNVQKQQYTRVNQTHEEANSTSESQTLNGFTRRRKPVLRILCHLVLVCFIVGFVLLLTITWKHEEGSNDGPGLPDRSSPIPSIPSRTTSIPPSIPPSNPPSDPPGDTPKPPSDPKQPEDPNMPGHLPDGSSCGAGCIVSSYRWPIDDNMRSFGYIQSGQLTMGRAYIKRSRSAGPGNFYVSLGLTGIKMSDITLVFSPSRSNRGASVIFSTPKVISPFSRIEANITVELPLDTIHSLQEFMFLAQNTDITFEEIDESNTFEISKLQVATTNADLMLSPFFTTAASSEIKTRNGDIFGIVRSKGKVEVSNANGDIDLDMVGDTGIIYTTNGDVTGEYVCSAKCDFQTSSGDLKLRRIQTKSLLLDNKNGKIDVRNISSAFNVVVSGRNDPMKLQVQSVIPGALIVLSNKNAAVDLTMPMEYRGRFYVSTSSSYKAKAELVNPPDPGHSLSFRVVSGNYVDGTKLSPSNVREGSISVDNDNGDATLVFADE
ncbi:hypothetical protein BC943DRAFT_381748 [Umbelopsis sp. AD052]|nr:hypothetical protein BC943DRAFT_381748 [Umbelopsis sp. AD052]